MKLLRVEYKTLDIGEGTSPRKNLEEGTSSSGKKENLEEVKFQLSIANHPEHIYIDSFNTFSKINQHIPTDQRFHSFLVDSNGKPIFVGNPLSNMRLAEIFHDIIQSEATNQK